MANPIELAAKAYRQKGVAYTTRKACTYGLRTAVESLGQTVINPDYSSYNGITVNESSYTYYPTYEDGIITHLKDAVVKDDTVVIVGGGFGVSAVHAALLAPRGNVVVFEPSTEMASIIGETTQLNEVSERVDVVRKGVGVVNSARGSSPSHEVVDTSELPECDVLSLDCEGAESEILRDMEMAPRTVIVEAHEKFDSPPAEVEELLREEGYHVKSRLNHVGDEIPDQTELPEEDRFQTVILAEK